MCIPQTNTNVEIKLKVALRGMACDESVWYAQKVDTILGWIMNAVRERGGGGVTSLW